MVMIATIIVVCLQLGTSGATQSSVSAVPVYGFSGASAATSSGRSLHFTIHLKKCQQLSGPAEAEFAETFGGRVTSWRSFNDRDVAPIPFMTFYDQKTVFNNTGHLAQLSREVQLWGNDTAFVTTLIFTADYSQMTYMYTHACSMTTATTRGNIDLEASSNPPEMLGSFEDIVTGLEEGDGVHFTAMTFLCTGGKEHSFSTFGGHIENYDLVYDDDALLEIKTSIGQTAYYDVRYNMGVLDVINMRIFSNRSVDIYDDLAVPPEMHRMVSHRSQCFLSTGMPGGMVHVWKRGGPSGAIY